MESMKKKDKRMPLNMMKLNLKNLKDQVVVITGASSGIGLATARMAAEKGAKVVAAARNEEALQTLVSELTSKGQDAIYVTADVGIEEEVNNIAAKAIEKYGRFDTWINVAGVTIFGHAMDVSIEDMKKMFDTVYWGVVYGSRAAVRHFQERNEPSALINVGSLLGDRGAPIQSSYASAKFAVHGWTESLRTELEKDHVPVSVTLIHPGRVDTPYNEHAKNYMDKKAGHRSMEYPPEVLAEAILFCAEHPKRDMFAGGQAKLLKILGDFFPRLTDKVEELYLYPTQHLKQQADSDSDTALHSSNYGMHERGTNAGWKRKTSVYVKAAKKPVLSSLIVIGAGAATHALLKMKFK